ncbi:hypothetical protein [Muricoccus nepalensis]|uniref:hypothetical protein n=1 Tax=Muricoccus nepalensis TaxID=1854500 RepID=UPI001127A634|nr:hypothetical protein [Roseomonas nepalensis]
MPIDQAEVSQLTARFSEALQAGQIRLAEKQLGCLSDILAEAIADDELSIQRLLKSTLNEAHIVFSRQTIPTPGTSIAPGDALMLGTISALGGVANSGVRNQRMKEFSSAGRDAFAFTVLQEVGRSSGPVSNHDIAKTLEVYAKDLRPTLSHLQDAGLVRVTPSAVSSQYTVSRRGLSALQNGSVPVEVATADTPGEDDKPLLGMRR